MTQKARNEQTDLSIHQNASIHAEGGKRATRQGAWLVGAAGMAIETAALLVMAGMSVYGVVTGDASTTTRATTEAVVLAVLALGLGLLAWNLLRHKSLAKTPTLLWNAMLVPVAFSVFDGGAPALGIATGVVAAVTFVATLFVPRFEMDDDEDSSAVL